MPTTLAELVAALDTAPTTFNFPPALFELMTDPARRIAQLAVRMATAHHCTNVTSEYVAFALAAEGQNVASVALDSLGVTQDLIQRAFEALPTDTVDAHAPGERPLFSYASILLLGRLAQREAAQIDVTDYIAPEHIALAIVCMGAGCNASMALAGLGVDLDLFRQRVIALLADAPAH